MSIHISYSSWEKENNFDFNAGEYKTFDQFLTLIKSTQHQINDRLTSMLQNRGDLIPGTAKSKLQNQGQQGNKKVKQSPQQQNPNNIHKVQKVQKNQNQLKPESSV